MAKTKKALTELKKNSEKQEKEKLKENMYKVLSQIFTPGQIKMLLHPKKLIAWSSEDIANAMSLRCVSPKGLSVLAQRYENTTPWSVYTSKVGK